VNLLVSELYRFQNARSNDKSSHLVLAVYLRSVSKRYCIQNYDYFKLRIRIVFPRVWTQYWGHE